MADTELQRAEKRFAQAKARLQGIRNREATKQRKCLGYRTPAEAFRDELMKLERR